jgi:mannitol-1-phosphate/altronate dehydrogenase
MKKILIYGAGAIGRGFLAPVFYREGYKIYFVDNNKELINCLKKRNSYKTAFSNHHSYEIVEVKYEKAFLPGEEISILKDMDLVFSCVGPNNIKAAIMPYLENVHSIISLENEIESVEKIKEITKNKNCFFGIPDVITSSDAPEELKKIDSLCLVSEAGTFAIEKGNYELPENIPTYSEEGIKKYWNCKFYLHNMPHAVAAFLGKLFKVSYLHESMAIPVVEKVVGFAMEETKEAMKIKKMADEEFIDFYAEKELTRFKDKFLFDPVARVGREPLRKLRPHDRLIQSVKFIEGAGRDATGVYIAIKAAIYDAIINPEELDVCNFGSNLTEKQIIKDVCGLDENTSTFKALSKGSIFSMLSEFGKQREVKMPVIRVS